jgi:TRAP-type C4-dicarboxylate transport system permease small subunit
MKVILKYLDNLSDTINRALQIILALLSVVMVVVNLAQISGRYLFFHSIPWSEELSTYVYVWIIFLSLHMITREHAELSIDVLIFKNKKTELRVKIIRDILTIITVVILLAASVLIIKNSIRFPRKTASLGINTVGLYYCMPISFVLVLLQRVTNLLHNADVLRGKTAPAEDNRKGVQ